MVSSHYHIIFSINLYKDVGFCASTVRTVLFDLLDISHEEPTQLTMVVPVTICRKKLFGLLLSDSFKDKSLRSHHLTSIFGLVDHACCNIKYIYSTDTVMKHY